MDIPRNETVPLEEQLEVLETLGFVKRTGCPEITQEDRERYERRPYDLLLEELGFRVVLKNLGVEPGTRKIHCHLRKPEKAETPHCELINSLMELTGTDKKLSDLFEAEVPWPQLDETMLFMMEAQAKADGISIDEMMRLSMPPYPRLRVAFSLDGRYYERYLLLNIAEVDFEISSELECALAEADESKYFHHFYRCAKDTCEMFIYITDKEYYSLIAEKLDRFVEFKCWGWQRRNYVPEDHLPVIEVALEQQLQVLEELDFLRITGDKRPSFPNYYEQWAYGALLEALGGYGNLDDLDVTPGPLKLYSLDCEVYEIGTMYTDFVAGLMGIVGGERIPVLMVSESLDEGEDALAKVTLTVADRNYEWESQCYGDWLDDSIAGLINSILKELGCSRRFYSFGGMQSATFIFSDDREIERINERLAEHIAFKAVKEKDTI